MIRRLASAGAAFWLSGGTILAFSIFDKKDLMMSAMAICMGTAIGCFAIIAWIIAIKPDSLDL